MQKGVMTAAVGGLVAVAVWAGIALAQDQQPAPQTPTAPGLAKKDWSRLKVSTIASGGVCIFDPDNGKFYIYDPALENCVQVRKLVNLGDPLVRGDN